MKSMMVAVMAVIAGLNTGCAQIEYLQNPDNYRVNPLNGNRMYCHGDQRDGSTICEGWMSRAQIDERASVASALAKKRYLVESSLGWQPPQDRDRVPSTNEVQYTIAEQKLLRWAETATLEQVQQAVAVRNTEYTQMMKARGEAERLATNAQFEKNKRQALADAKAEKAAEKEHKKHQAEYERLIKAQNDAAKKEWDKMTPEEKADAERLQQEYFDRQVERNRRKSAEQDWEHLQDRQIQKQRAYQNMLSHRR